MKRFAAVIAAGLALGACANIGPRGPFEAERALREGRLAGVTAPETIPEVTLPRAETVRRESDAEATLRRRDAVLGDPRAAHPDGEDTESFAGSARQRAQPPARAD
ncbi:MAG: hypothetical protein KIS81_01135 [Maricaulaceae bacterium]|nr:hypothetical protein [Maricaulaceae bacterium]